MPMRQPEDVFFDLLRKGLNHYDDAEWLGKHSPLASPYFLGERLVGVPNGDTAQVRGELFQQLVMEAFEVLWGGEMPASQQQFKKMVREEQGNQGVRYACYVLDLRYLRRYFTKNQRPDKRVKPIATYVNVSDPALFLHLKKARQRLGQLLLQRVQPMLRPESPTMPKQFVGRTVTLNHVIKTLRTGASVSLTGMGGVGKSSLGTAAVEAWAGRTFWFTVRPGLNDHVQSFLFALADSLKHQGRIQLWTYLRAQMIQTEQQQDGSPLNSIVVEALRTDLSDVAAGSFLICVDEVDRLLSADHHPRKATHQALIELIDMLRAYVPCLLIGQRAIVDTAEQIVLNGLTQDETAKFIKNAGQTLTDTMVARLHEHTKGIPRLLMVTTVLLERGEDVVALWSAGKTPNLQTLFARLWQRLSDAEQTAIAYLSVFQRPIPPDGWKPHEKALSSLKERGVVEKLPDGTVQLFTIFRWHIYQHELVQEQRVQYHRQAGAMYASLGEFTDAALHFKEAGDYLAAFQVWYPFRDIELLRGHGVIARHLFESITAVELQGDYEDELNALKMRLDNMEGRLSQVVQRIKMVDWSADSEAAAEAHRLAAESYWHLGETIKAQELFEDSLAIYGRIAQKTSYIHFQRGNIFARNGDVEQAEDARKTMEYDLARLSGRIATMKGDFAQAKTAYETALAIAIELDNEQLEANIYTSLAQLLGTIGEVDKATEFGNKYITFCKKTHNRMLAMNMRAELAGMNLNAGRFEAVIEQGEPLLPELTKIKHTGMVSKLCTFLSEAYYKLGDLEQAKQYVGRVLEIEETGDMPDAFYIFGLIQKTEGKTDEAITAFQQGIDIAIQINNRFIEAHLQRELGEVYCCKDNKKAIRCLSRAIQLFERMGLEKKLEATQEILGKLL